MFRKIFIGSYITIFLLCILSKFLLNTDMFLIYFIVTIIIVSLLVNICLILKINFICVYIVTIYKRLGYIDNKLSYKTEKFFLKTIQFIIFVVMVWIDIYSASKIKKYKNLS